MLVRTHLPAPAQPPHNQGTQALWGAGRWVHVTVPPGSGRDAIRIFNEKMSPGSDGMVNEAELMTITGADFPSIAEMEEEDRSSANMMAELGALPPLGDPCDGHGAANG